MFQRNTLPGRQLRRASMKEIEVGIRIDPEEGISFSGIEMVNGFINLGAKVVSIEPGGAIMRKLGESDENVSLTLAGCEMKVVLDDSLMEESPRFIEHNDLFEQGCELIKPYMQLSDRAAKESKDSEQELRKGIELLNRAAEIHPGNWSAFWMIGKAHQALGDSDNAFEAFGKSYGINRYHADIAREYMFECLNLGHGEKAVAAANRAVSSDPENAGLVSNLALAHLIAGNLDRATEAVERAIAMDLSDSISQNLRTVIEEVKSKKRPQPTRMADLQAK